MLHVIAKHACAYTTARKHGAVNDESLTVAVVTGGANELKSMACAWPDISSNCA